MKAEAQRESANIVSEAHGEARAVIYRAAVERERLEGEMRRIKALLRSALETVEEAALDKGEKVGEATGEIRRLIS